MNIHKPETAISLAGIATGLLLVYIILLGRVGLSSGRKNAAVWDLPANKIEKIVIANGDEELVFDLSENAGWGLRSPADIPFSREIANALPLTLSSLTAEKEISSNLNSLQEYGLDKPITIDVVLRNRKEYRLLLGGESSSGTSRYFSVNGKIYTMSAIAADAIALDSINVRDRNILRFNRTLRPSYIAARIANIRVNGANYPELADALSLLNAASFIRDVNFPVVYTIEFDYDGEPRVLYIGEHTAEYYRAKTPENDAAFTISKRGLENIASLK